MNTASPYSTPRHALILAGTDEAGKPAAHDRRARIEAAWAVGHDLAAEKYGPDKVPDWFGPDGGPALMARLQAAPADASAETLMQMVRTHLKIDDKPKEVPADATPRV